MGYLKTESKRCVEIMVTKFKTNMETAIQVFWNMSCLFVKRYRCVRLLCCLQFLGRPRNTLCLTKQIQPKYQYIPNDMTSKPKTLKSSETQM